VSDFTSLLFLQTEVSYTSQSHCS